MTEAGLRAAVEAWIADDPDEGDRDELRALVDRAFGASGTGETAGAGGERGADGEHGGDGEHGRDGDAAGALAELGDRFAGRLTFGTAGLRGVVAAGPYRMNRAVVRAATAAVAGWLTGDGPVSGKSTLSVVVGCDARHRSAQFADEAARVLAGAGLAVHMLPQPGPTPLLAFAVRYLCAAAG